MPAPIQQIPSQEIFCELRLQKTQEVRRENMGNMISVHREECNYEGTEQLRNIFHGNFINNYSNPRK